MAGEPLSLAERVAVLIERAEAIEEWRNDLIGDLRKEFELIDRQRSDLKATPAGREVLERMGRVERATAGLTRDVENLDDWRKGLLSEVKATLRLIRVGISVVLGTVALLGSILGVAWAAHQLGLT